MYLLNFEGDFCTFFEIFLKISTFNNKTTVIRTWFLLLFDIAFLGKVIEL